MKPASPALVTYLTRRQQKYADCYEFVLRDDVDNPTILRYTTATSNVRAIPPGEMDYVTYEAGRVLVSGLRYRLAIGTDVDEQEVEITVKPNTTVLGLPFLVAMRKGIFAKALVKRTRYWFNNWGEEPVGGIVFFSGFMSSIMDLGSIGCKAKVKSGMILLNTPMPNELYQPQCLNTLFDARCKLDPADWAEQGTAETGSTTSVILWAGATLDDFNQGVIRFETGPNIGVIRTVKKSTGGALILTLPLDFEPTNTDDFVVFPGCDKTKARCNVRFSNIENFRGFPFIPSPETAM